MNLQELTSLLLSVASISIGAFFGALGNKLSSEKDNSPWVLGFYILGLIALIVPVILSILYWQFVSNWLISTSVAISTISAILIIIYTKKVLDKKHIYDAGELDPIINKFTEIADKNEIKLFGGDLNFFGESVNQINENSQYVKLRSLSFKKVMILCEQPKSNDVTTKIRYGKIITEIENVKLRFYDPEEADLRIRGRILKVNGVSKLLMFNKIESKRYKAIETDTANSNGALYNNIWDLVWSLGIQPEIEELKNYQKLFRGS